MAKTETEVLTPRQAAQAEAAEATARHNASRERETSLEAKRDALQAEATEALLRDDQKAAEKIAAALAPIPAMIAATAAATAELDRLRIEKGREVSRLARVEAIERLRADRQRLESADEANAAEVLEAWRHLGTLLAAREALSARAEAAFETAKQYGVHLAHLRPAEEILADETRKLEGAGRLRFSAVKVAIQ